jgi:hypothetical protein
LDEDIKSEAVCASELQEQLRQLKGKNIYFDYFVFNIVDRGLPRSGARRRALAQTIGNTRGLNINSPLGAEAHTQDLRFRRYQQRDDPNSGTRQQLRIRSWL